MPRLQEGARITVYLAAYDVDVRGLCRCAICISVLTIRLAPTPPTCSFELAPRESAEFARSSGIHRRDRGCRLPTAIVSFIADE